MDIKELLSTKTPEEIFAALAKKQSRKVSLSECKSQYDPRQHDVFDPILRPKKKVKKATGEKDDAGKPTYEEVLEEVVRVGVPMQKLIVARAESFMLGNPIDMEEKYLRESAVGEKVLHMVEKIWEDNKLDYRNRELFEILDSECEVAELWYLEKLDDPASYWGDLSKAKYRMRMKILSDRTNDELYPYFSETGDMIAFSRKYSIEYIDQEIEYFDVYTADKNYYYTKTKSEGWQLDKEREVESTGKIHVVYWRVKEPGWYDVQPMIDRLETTISNTGDTNDYSGAPITVAEGKIEGFASKGERGKIIQIEKGGSLKYLESANAPESIKLEIDTLDKYIHMMTRTANLSPDQITGLGALSGVALKLLFTDAHAKAMKNWGIFGEGIQRRLNLLKHICGSIDTALSKDSKNLSIKPKMTPYLPVDEEGWNAMITESLSLGAISRQTAAENLTFISDPEQEIERIKQEKLEDLGGSSE